MKKVLIVVISVCFTALFTSFLYTKVTQEKLRWINGEFELPSEIQKINSIDELKSFLDSKDEFTRMASVRRLGEIGGEKAVGLLVEIFNKEPYEVRRAPVGAPIVKLEIIRTLERIGGKEAKFALLSILNAYWEKGPSIGNERKELFYWDGDFTTIVPLTLESLYKWNRDNEVFQTVQKIAFGEDVRKFYLTSRIGENAWKLNLKGFMVKKGIVEEKGSAYYLLDFIENVDNETNQKLEKNSHVSVDLEGVKRKVALAILKEIDESTLSVLSKEFDKKFAKELRGPNNSLTEHHNALRRKQSYIEKILKEKKQKNKN